MDVKQKLPCLGRFATHSCYPWFLRKEDNIYYQECSLLGCNFSQTAATLMPVGETAFVVQGDQAHEHNWIAWQCTETQFGTYTPPWLYKRKCSVCDTEQMAENLEKAS